MELDLITFPKDIHPDRIQLLNDEALREGANYVLYWVQKSGRAEWNHAFEYAIRLSKELNCGIIAAFGLGRRNPGSAPRRRAGAGIHARGIGKRRNPGRLLECRHARTRLPANHLRMYWGKQILRYTNTPSYAYQTALYLNNKYLLDGRDHNSFSNIAWLFGLHDQGWQEREVFGKVRTMPPGGLERKTDPEKYMEKVGFRSQRD